MSSSKVITSAYTLPFSCDAKFCLSMGDGFYRDYNIHVGLSNSKYRSPPPICYHVLVKFLVLRVAFAVLQRVLYYHQVLQKVFQVLLLVTLHPLF